MNSQKESSKVKKELNQIKPKHLFEKLKTKYFIQNIFDKLLKKKVLEIIKYNKRQQKLLNITIKDYKEYSEKYSSIQIEIIPINNKYGKFINIKKEDEIYYHIYFNNNPEEIKRNYTNKDEEIEIIKIIIDYQIISFKFLFCYSKCIESIYFKKFYRNNISNMNGMFNECLSLKELNLNNFNINNVTDMSYMFYKCSSLKELNINNFNTNNLIIMMYMFSYCSKDFIRKIKAQYKNIKEEAFINIDTNI